MIQSAMMFALGVFVTGLAALGFCVLLVKRTRRVTERRILANVSARRAEFEAERDELRARHAIQLHRLEREVGRVLDMATAHRLDADVKDRDLIVVQAEMKAKDDEIRELQERLGELRETLQELERKHAESSSSLRAARHALKLESRRRSAVETTFDEALAAADEKTVEVSALQAQLEALRMSVSQEEMRTEDEAAGRPEFAASVVALPLRTRLPTAGDADWDGTMEEGGAARPALALVDSIAIMPAAEAPSAAAPEAASGSDVPDHLRDDANPETLFVEALAEIRALKRAAAEAAE